MRIPCYKASLRAPRLPLPLPAVQALRTVRKDSFRKAANELNQKGGIVDRLGGPDRVHDVIQVGEGHASRMRDFFGGRLPCLTG